MTNGHNPDQTKDYKTQLESTRRHHMNAIMWCREKKKKCHGVNNAWLRNLFGRRQGKGKTLVPTWDLSGCCRWMGTWPRCLRAGEWGRICCTETRRRDSTVAVGRGPCSWRRGRRRSWPSGRWRRRRRSGGRAGCLCAARGRSRHRGKMGLGQESGDKAKNWGPAHRNG